MVTAQGVKQTPPLITFHHHHSLSINHTAKCTTRKPPSWAPHTSWTVKITMLFIFLFCFCFISSLFLHQTLFSSFQCHFTLQYKCFILFVCSLGFPNGNIQVLFFPCLFNHHHHHHLLASESAVESRCVWTMIYPVGQMSLELFLLSVCLQWIIFFLSLLALLLSFDFVLPKK